MMSSLRQDMRKRRILFVDDEQNVLDGLRRLLRFLRQEFELCFAESGEAALRMFAEQTFDVVVSDMRMPGMDGADLLAEVQKKYPHAIRIMLTGQADDASTLRTIGIVHQFLAKPCEPEKLKSTILRASALHRLIIDGNLKNLVSGIDTLPSLPSVYVKLQEELQKPEVSLDDVAAIISADLAMTAKILQLVNSAFFGFFQKVDSPARAVKLLGIDTIKALVLGSQVFTEMKISGKLFSAETLWRHSMTVGTLAQKIAASEGAGKELTGNSYLAGILHDIGKLVLVSKLESMYSEVILIAQKEKVQVTLAEEKVFQATHGDLGAYLTGLWGFPSDIVEAIGFHHQAGNSPTGSFTAALAVHIANALYYQYYPDEIIGIAPFDEAGFKQLPFGEKLPKWKKICFDYLDLQKG